MVKYFILGAMTTAGVLVATEFYRSIKLENDNKEFFKSEQMEQWLKNYLDERLAHERKLFETKLSELESRSKSK